MSGQHAGDNQMPFNHVIDQEKNIIVLKAKGTVSVKDIFSEIQQAISTRRGDGLARRLIDMTDQDLSAYIEDAPNILKMMSASAKALHSKRIAILFKEIPADFDFEKLIAPLKSETSEIELFTDKSEAVKFLNKPFKT